MVFSGGFVGFGGFQWRLCRVWGVSVEVDSEVDGW